ncbi:Asp-tRNA(Asn)/Glu-tRNA(Gln) amidotransferase subunit GatC [Lewinella cohaerens]|uniref:Asp-tRNA(Asn)/Glu-tRNA(Gln) amidotransferase subunit GatC n=1 Tax=Lewinella cohaerens TaxID=70995 RepID=UPI001FE0BB25|nr:Asp-tRNA(Asn)/Glu-tRNA(Gln) amidotransferase subunit GatC [Lewinella cohaerens]
MMKIDDQLISRLENLARLQLSATEKEGLKTDLTNILGMVEKLQKLDVEDVEPLVYLNEAVNRQREDVINNQVDREAALRNAPDQDGTFFRVPKVIDL